MPETLPAAPQVTAPVALTRAGPDPCPEPALLLTAARLTGRGGAIEKLLGSLRIDDSATRHRFGWQPRVAFDDALAATCRWYRQRDAGGTTESAP